MLPRGGRPLSGERRLQRKVICGGTSGENDGQCERKTGSISAG
jgi:hypothetical protein